jgi:hypothetical protein
VSIYPCDLCRHRVPGSLEACRFTLLSGGARYSRRMRLCSSHLREIVEAPGLKWISAEDVSDGVETSVCDSCSVSRDQAVRLNAAFRWVWQRGAEPLESYAQLCEACSLLFINTHGLREALPPTVPHP